MRKSLWIILALLFVASRAPNAHADTITTGTLSFTLGACCVAPTAGSFAFDNTTNQFTSFAVIWDGLKFDLTSGATQTNFLALTGAIPSPLTWTAACLPSTVNPTVPCDGLLFFGLFAGTPVVGSALTPLVPTMNLAVGGGTFTVTQSVTTPEPGAVSLLLMGVGLVLVMRNRIVKDGQRGA